MARVVVGNLLVRRWWPRVARAILVATFRGRAQQDRWLRIVTMYDDRCVASKPGVIVEPDQGQRRVARIAARRLSGRVVCG